MAEEVVSLRDAPAVTAAGFREAARLCDLHESGVRAGDALHLGMVANHGEHPLSLDRVQVDVAGKAGTSARLS